MVVILGTGIVCIEFAFRVFQLMLLYPILIHPQTHRIAILI